MTKRVHCAHGTITHMKLFPVNRDNVFKGLMYAMLLSATCHLMVNLYMAVSTNDPDLINMFNVLGLSLIFPALGHGALNNLLGILFVIAIGVWFYFMQQYHDQKRTKKK